MVLRTTLRACGREGALERVPDGGEVRLHHAAAGFGENLLRRGPLGVGLGERVLLTAVADEELVPLGTERGHPTRHVVERPGDLGELDGVALDAVLLRRELGDLVDDALPVELGPVAEHLEPVEGVGAVDELVLAGDERVTATAQVSEARAHCCGLAEERVDLRAVRPAEDEAAAVVDTVPVVLLVVRRRVLDLALTGQGARGEVEVRHRLDAVEGRAAGELALEPRVERRLLDLEHLDEHGPLVALGALVPSADVGGDTVVDEALAHVVVVDPRGDGRVVLGRHEQREREAAQDPLGGTLPRLVLRAHGDELARERQLVLGQPEAGAQPGADGQAALREARRTTAQAGDLVRELAAVELDVAEREVEVADGGLDLGELGARDAERGAGLRATGLELLRTCHRLQARGREVPGVLAGAAFPVDADVVEAGDRRLDLREAVPALPRALELEAAALRLERGDLGAETGQPRVAHPDGCLQLGDPGAEELVLAVRGEEAQRVALRGGRGDPLSKVRVGVAVGDDRREVEDLGAGPRDGVVRAREVVEVPDELVRPAARVERLEHVVADELVEVAHGLHRDGLVEEVHGLVGLDAEDAAEVLAVVGEGLTHLGARLPQAPAQCVDVAVEVREVLGDRHARGGRDVEAVGLALLAVLEPEHLSQDAEAVIAPVGELPEDDRVRAALAQADGPRRAGRLVALRLVVPGDVGAQGALARLRARSLVVADAVRRQQERGDRVDDGRLARADVTGEQGVAPLELEAPRVAVEGAPVEDLEALEAEAGTTLDVRLRVVELDRAEESLHQSSVPAVSGVVPVPPASPVPVACSRYSPSRASSSESHWASTKALRMRRTSKAPPSTSRRNPSWTARRTCTSTLSTRRASFDVDGRNTRSISTISSRSSTRRVSPPSESNCASRLRRSASSRLTSNGRLRRATRRSVPSRSSSSSGSAWR